MESTQKELLLAAIRKETKENLSKHIFKDQVPNFESSISKEIPLAFYWFLDSFNNDDTEFVLYLTKKILLESMAIFSDPNISKRFSHKDYSEDAGKVFMRLFEFIDHLHKEDLQMDYFKDYYTLKYPLYDLTQKQESNLLEKYNCQ